MFRALVAKVANFLGPGSVSQEKVIAARLAAIESRSAATQGNIANQINLLAAQINQLQNAVLGPVSIQTALLESTRDLTVQSAGELAAFENRSAATQGNIANQINLLAAQINQLQNAVLGPVGIQTALLESTRNLTVQSAGELAAFENRSAATQGNIANQINLLAAQINQLHNAVLGPINIQGALIDTLRDLILRLESAVATGGNGLAAQVNNVSEKLGAVEGEVNRTQNVILGPVNVQAALLETLTGLVLRVEQALAQRTNAIDISLARIGAEGGLTEHLRLLTARGMAALVKRSVPPLPPTLPVIEPHRPLPPDDLIAQFRAEAPLNIDAWLKTFEAGTVQGAETSEGTLSHEGHPGATYFRMFVNIHARDRVLDAGCGALPLPQYLADWPVAQIAGFDPIAAPGRHPFPFVQTFAENIPWPDASFETVVVGTSLDHVYLLDKALDEIHRVLVPGGRLLLWTAIFDETAVYDPYSVKITPPDAFHLFHPGRNWFYALFDGRYRLIERIQTVASAEFIAYERRD